MAEDDSGGLGILLRKRGDCIRKFANSPRIFYDAKLRSHPISLSRVLEGHKWLDGAGLWIVPVEHEGNRNSSAEEVEAVARIVEDC